MPRGIVRREVCRASLRLDAIPRCSRPRANTPPRRAHSQHAYARLSIKLPQKQRQPDVPDLEQSTSTKEWPTLSTRKTCRKTRCRLTAKKTLLCIVRITRLFRLLLSSTDSFGVTCPGTPDDNATTHKTCIVSVLKCTCEKRSFLYYLLNCQPPCCSQPLQTAAHTRPRSSAFLKASCHCAQAPSACTRAGHRTS